MSTTCIGSKSIMPEHQSSDELLSSLWQIARHNERDKQMRYTRLKVAPGLNISSPGGAWTLCAVLYFVISLTNAPELVAARPSGLVMKECFTDLDCPPYYSCYRVTQDPYAMNVTAADNGLFQDILQEPASKYSDSNALPHACKCMGFYGWNGSECRDLSAATIGGAVFSFVNAGMLLFISLQTFRVIRLLIQSRKLKLHGRDLVLIINGLVGSPCMLCLHLAFILVALDGDKTFAVHDYLIPVLNTIYGMTVIFADMNIALTWMAIASTAKTLSRTNSHKLQWIRIILYTSVAMFSVGYLLLEFFRQDVIAACFLSLVLLCLSIVLVYGGIKLGSVLKESEMAKVNSYQTVKSVQQRESGLKTMSTSIAAMGGSSTGAGIRKPPSIKVPLRKSSSFDGAQAALFALHNSPHGKSGRIQPLVQQCQPVPTTTTLGMAQNHHNFQEAPTLQTSLPTVKASALSQKSARNLVGNANASHSARGNATQNLQSPKQTRASAGPIKDPKTASGQSIMAHLNVGFGKNETPQSTRVIVTAILMAALHGPLIVGNIVYACSVKYETMGTLPWFSKLVGHFFIIVYRGVVLKQLSSSIQQAGAQVSEAASQRSYASRTSVSPHARTGGKSSHVVPAPSSPGRTGSKRQSPSKRISDGKKGQSLSERVGERESKEPKGAKRQTTLSADPQLTRVNNKSAKSAGNMDDDLDDDFDGQSHAEAYLETGDSKQVKDSRHSFAPDAKAPGSHRHSHAQPQVVPAGPGASNIDVVASTHSELRSPLAVGALQLSPIRRPGITPTKHRRSSFSH